MKLTRQFRRTHVILPGVGFALALVLLGAFDLDRTIAHALFFDSTSKQWLGAGDGMWWARDVIHTGGCDRLVYAAPALCADPGAR